MPGPSLPSSLARSPHRRLNALTGDWVLVSPRRNERPWHGQVDDAPPADRSAFDPNCHLCPGAERAGGVRNPAYTGSYVFDNDFPALHPLDREDRLDEQGLLVARGEPGRCRVVVFSPRHDRTLPELERGEARRLVDVWTEEFVRLGAEPDIGYVQIFENKGAVMGCSNPHPHGQIWAQRAVPVEPAREGLRFEAHQARHGRTLLADYLRLELEIGERVVCANDGFVALVPFWAVWPFELLVVSRRAVPNLASLTDDERDHLADILQRVTTRYDNLFATSFPYSAGFHQAPTDGRAHPAWHLHAHFLPPLLRSASVRKFLVGYEMLAEPQRDLTPEAAAERLRAQSESQPRAASL